MAEPDIYSERYVAFLDVLGFSQLVREADTDGKKRGLIRSIIRSLRETFEEVPTSTGFRFTQFSDCIVISADRSEDGLIAVATGCVGLAGGMMAEGILLRGGLAVGNLLHTGDALFGTGLLKAYKNDATGSPPRIALCEQTYQDAIKYDLESLTRRDMLDLSPMLHTLWEYETHDPNRPDHLAIGAEARLVANHISKNAHNMDLPAAVRAKWRWLMLYWNASAEETKTLPVLM
jgi:hypothetical protein